VESTLGPPMRGALELAWESFAVGSFGIGAVVTDRDGTVVATGRNRILEHDPGDDVLAGSSLAHAEMNGARQTPLPRPRALRPGAVDHVAVVRAVADLLDAAEQRVGLADS
jgi:tRNA(Arg) A34 adenosine deaminase TadA